jgi:predicted DCC family thiol-disulfide oxidoreductase YuxK
VTAPALLLWDGDCGFCRRSVQWAERRDVTHAFQAVPYQQAPSPPMTPALREACARAVHLVTPAGDVLRAGRACLWVLERIGFPRLARVLAVPPLVWFVEVGYWLVARNRRLASRVLFRKGVER